MRIVCKPCLALVAAQVEERPDVVPGPRRCEVCGVVHQEQGKDFALVRNEYAEAAHEILADVLADEREMKARKTRHVAQGAATP